MNVRSYVPSILSMGPDCPECGSPMQASMTYHPRLYEHVESWACPAEDCEQGDLIRDEDAVPA